MQVSPEKSDPLSVFGNLTRNTHKRASNPIVRWSDWALRLGIGGYDRDTRRRLLIVNMAGYLSALSSLSFAFVLLTFVVGSIYAARAEASTTISTATERGASLYTTCAGCHGASGEGVSGLGVSLTNNDFVERLSDDELVAFIKVGRAADDPENKTGQVMPPWGGNPSLTEPDLHDLVAFLRMLQQEGQNQ